MSTIERPVAHGLLVNPGFSQVVIATGKRIIYTAGQVSIDEQGQLVGNGDLATQAAQAMRNVGLALAAAGAGHHQQSPLAILHERQATSEHTCRCRGVGGARMAS
jgi:enamine deaminase RidA (YjgF/YER057c/UK114 family)